MWDILHDLSVLKLMADILLQMMFLVISLNGLRTKIDSIFISVFRPYIRPSLRNQASLWIETDGVNLTLDLNSEILIYLLSGKTTRLLWYFYTFRIRSRAILESRIWILEPRVWILEPSIRILEQRIRILEPGTRIRILEPRIWIWTLEPGAKNWILELGTRI